MRSGISDRLPGAGFPAPEHQSEMLNNTNERNQSNTEAAESGSRKNKNTSCGVFIMDRSFAASPV